jgi:hypothetical protein
VTLYSVPIVDRKLVTLWHEYWDHKKPSKEAKAANRDGSLGRTALVKAKDKKHAAVTAERQNPGCVAIADAIERHR